MSTSRTPSIDQLLAQGLRERAALGSDDLLEQILREAASTPQGRTQPWRSGIAQGRLIFLATLGILVALAGAIAFGTGLVRLPVPPRMPQYHHNGVLLVVGGGLISQDADIGEAAAATEIVVPGHQGVFDVSWAPDGSRLVFSDTDGVFVAGIADGIPTEISACSGYCDVAYSPDGLTIAVTSGTDLLLVSPGGGGSRALVTRGDELSSPTWSPDGRRLAFVSTGATAMTVPTVKGERGASSTLWVVGTDGSKPVPLTDAAPSHDEIFDAAWSPDGKTIAYILTSDATKWQASGYTLTLESIRPDGSRQAMLADAGACYCLGYPRSGLTWSPDGSRIALGEPGEGTYLLNPDGTNPRRVSAKWAAPAWRPVP